MDNNLTSSAHRSPNPLEPSQLGTREYWEAAYDRELHNNKDDADDEGVIWFDESNAEDTVLKKLAEYSSSARGLLSRDASRVLDLGTGNGHMLFAMREDEDDDGASWGGEMVGVDYSPKSVELARQLLSQRQAATEGETGDYANVRFEEWDLLSDPPGDWLGDKFDVILDKGTFDAISLMPRDANAASHPCQTYGQKVVDLIKPGHFLFITSCNWTKDELINWLAHDGMELFDEANYPTFTFGGQTGQSVVTLVFRKTAD
ncbi:-lysine N-methyltransferase EFM4 [Lecanosticta acicola]|uniref:Protein-lysine N-methyltransferase EFM4 n=1 Tax=Lecanosticta acicola TaxID=111012 RepID=A0AAI8Z532_9PEZI|nr:-lysine N-methyltransferase EFM4 [Lecanosticta acicola]